MPQTVVTPQTMAYVSRGRRDRVRVITQNGDDINIRSATRSETLKYGRSQRRRGRRKMAIGAGIIAAGVAGGSALMIGARAEEASRALGAAAGYVGGATLAYGALQSHYGKSALRSTMHGIGRGPHITAQQRRMAARRRRRIRGRFA